MIPLVHRAGDVFGNHHFVWAQFTGQSSLWCTAAAIEEAADGSRTELLVVYGSETGTAEVVARRFAKNAKQH